MLTDYYKQEIRRLRKIAADYTRSNPELSRALSGDSADPDVSRVLEGVAFLSANIRQELDQQFPKLLHSLAQVVCPQYIRPLPATTIMAFEPRASLTQPLLIEKGTFIDSRAGEQGSCRFRTTEDMTLLPLLLEKVVTLPETQTPQLAVELHFTLQGTTLDQLPMQSLRLYLGGEFADASDLYFLLRQQLKSLTLVSGGEISLPTSAVDGTGFGVSQSIFGQRRGVMPAVDLLQQYFLCPQKFLFVDIDLSNWRHRSGDRFVLRFTCKKPNFSLPTLGKEHFVIHAVPAVNLFEHKAQSILLDPLQQSFQLLPAISNHSEDAVIYSVDDVESVARGMEKAREYIEFGGFVSSSDESAVYEIQYDSGQNSLNPDVYLKLAFPPGQQLEAKEILKAQLTCSNGELADRLQVGDISVATSSTPELATFKNITKPTPARRIPMDGDKLWRMISHLSLNYLSVTDADSLRGLLTLYVAPDAKAKSDRLLNEKKIEAITAVTVKQSETLFGHSFVHGQEIKVQLKSEFFASPGDKFLFGCVLEQFFAATSAINVYSELVFEDFFSGEQLQWPARIGSRPLQ
ncbi:type VI secretion system baseplate subunit TssF [Oceanobacter mangrovi]|uniref:type VI secretion system baseplate subunit TssF n=1 Tax=Oceanobacter mangrovi TaxID=2862510 RepID=UPI001C8DD982